MCRLQFRAGGARHGWRWLRSLWALLGATAETLESLFGKVRINKQSPDIAGAVYFGMDKMDVGAGDRGIVLGYASDETSDCMTLTHSMATRLGKTLAEVRKSGECW